MNKIVGLLLAAGSARRFGGNKLLQRLPDGELIIAASARTLAASTDRCIALIRPDQPQLRHTLANLGIECIEVMHADEGMGVTLASGVQATHEAAGWLVALGDMPRIKPDTVRAVAKAIRLGADIAAPFHEGQRGHPVGFAARWGEALSVLTGDTGARNILREQANAIVRVPVDDAGCLLDIDTPADLQALSSTQGFA
ncbi:nucleotidyltransferase family protein [Uliginosibacterium aquaticum]|uniref:Nucleotidyltransferase family protein n=1 Tax=Uliginosibacterium aquaticum TaxID=2731212 RepID=A0ABX2IKT5_9RHOO|nr:nucleotidyltransferase family protein [Uliginosibacterium aquaticum]NSL54938.1 nucleotidyltransferase family protein [Uliginosibacterium aquaticum]